mmetsp:Transcript_16831/g.26257  ORF Transcript_16831/g.26257 Transcript_16831/m.26257 type:complete len:113 (+) Transcript_16831:96-434(+)
MTEKTVFYPVEMKNGPSVAVSNHHKKQFNHDENKDHNLFLSGSNRLVTIYDTTPSVSCLMISRKMANFVLALIAYPEHQTIKTPTLPHRLPLLREKKCQWVLLPTPYHKDLT